DILRYGAERGHYPQAVGRVDDWVAERVALHRAGDSSLVQQLADGRSLRIVERRMPDGHIVGFRIDITEMARTTEAAQQASLAKSQFLANMSHEIRTPMNAILGMLALLGKTELTPRQADYATKTEGAARSLLGLLNDILDFSKVEAGKMTLDPQPFRIDHLLRDLTVILSTNVGPKRLEVLFDIDPALPAHVVGDAMRLQQVLINLGGNAIKFTDEGEVVVSIEVVERSGSAVTLQVAVRDTGIGIAPENQARIFSGFTQAEASTTRRFGGTGLGVAISQRLVGLMGGELGVDSTLGHGSRFHFCITLPVAADAIRPDAVEPLRALVVDDNPTARDVLSRMCGSLGWLADVAESGEEALERMRERAEAGAAYEAVFIDWLMPGLDGWQTSRRMRRLGLADAAPVIVMVTAHGREMLSQRSEADQAAIDGFLVKPVIASMLLDAVAEARGAKVPTLSPPAARREQRLAAMKVLLVEDNPNNQQVARELLEDEGARVRIAGHGQAAIEALDAAETAFDVVLMDLQMPVMDGFTATSRIRQEFGPQELPIVAMTANALAADREACLAIGMNDHVGKPFDLNQLVQVLCRNTGRQSAGAGVIDAGDAALSAPVREAAASAGVDLQPALDRLGGHRQVYQRMLAGFVADLADMPARLEALAADADWVAARRLLHTLKGVAATLGATALSSVAADAERQLVTPGDAEGVVQRTRHAIDAARPALAGLALVLQPAAIEARGSAPGAPDRAVVCAALRAMAVQLQNADMAATDAMRDLQRDFGAVLGAPLAAMDDAVGALDFERALRLCHDLIEGQRG
ncbi:MAG: response regulator, partial [Burkholderiaceae bacterium]